MSRLRSVVLEYWPTKLDHFLLFKHLEDWDNGIQRGEGISSQLCQFTRGTCEKVMSFQFADS